MKSLSLKLKISNETKFSGAQKLHRSAIYSFACIEKVYLFQLKNMILIADFIKSIGLEERLDVFCKPFFPENANEIPHP